MGTIEDLERDWEEASDEHRKTVENNLRAGDILGQQIADELSMDMEPLMDVAGDPAIQGLLSTLLANNRTMTKAMIDSPEDVSHLCEMILFIGARWQREKYRDYTIVQKLLDSLDD